MKSSNLNLTIATILCLTSCAQSPVKTSTTSDTTKELTSKESASKEITTNKSDNSKLVLDVAQKLLEYRLEKEPDHLIICTVNNVPITLGDYRREFKMEQQQVQATLTYNAQLANQLLKVAHQQGIALTKDEKATLLKSTSKMQVGGKKSFDKMLAESHMDKQQFTKQIIDMGLACKTANVLVESNLLGELVNHELLSQAAKTDGFSKDAMNKYTQVSRTPEYQKLVSTGAFSADDLRTQIITNELCNKETEKIKSESPVNDIELNDFYEKNRGKLRHSARLRFSSIFIALPSEQKNQQEKYELAKSYLERAQKGESFSALADQYSEDPSKKKNDGGDIGFQEEDKLKPDFAAKIGKSPAGTVIPEVVVSPHGYHIFKITEKESPGFYRLAEVKDQLKDALGQEKGKQTVNDWLNNQRQKATIVISPELTNLLASNKLPLRDDARSIKHRNLPTQISGQGQHF